jgi:nucleotide-binding universal stress UspA family protein
VDATVALQQAEASAQPLHEVAGKLVEGDPLRALLAEVERQHATAVVVGSHGRARATGIALGSVTTHLLHDAPCPVLVARGNVTGRWPRRIVVGLDGSEDSARACEAARELAERHGADVRAVVATRERGVDLEAALAVAPDLEEHDSRAVDLLSVYAGPSDLVVVGSRGLRGLRALGSVSERIAHESRSSVLVVRPRA